jgi:hypothetical protein
MAGLSLVQQGASRDLLLFAVQLTRLGLAPKGIIALPQGCPSYLCLSLATEGVVSWQMEPSACPKGCYISSLSAKKIIKDFRHKHDTTKVVNTATSMFELDWANPSLFFLSPLLFRTTYARWHRIIWTSCYPRGSACKKHLVRETPKCPTLDHVQLYMFINLNLIAIENEIFGESSKLKVRSRILLLFALFSLRFALIKQYSLTLFFEVFRWKEKNSIERQ